MFAPGMGFGSEQPSNAAPKYEIFNATQSGSILGTQAGEAARAGVRQEDRMACLPLTVRIVEDAVERQRATGVDELRVHGVEMGQSSMMLLVGAVEQLVKQTSSVQFVLNDGTGRVKVRHYTTSDADSAGLEGIVDGGYITVVGSVRTSPALHISATFLHPVASANEVSYHMIEVAHAALKLKQVASGVTTTTPTSFTTPSKSKLASPTQALAELSPPKEVAPEVVPQPLPALANPATAAKTLESMKHTVAEFLRREAEGQEAGLHVDAVCAGLKEESAAVRAALDALVEDGDVYTTISEDHFAPL